MTEEVKNAADNANEAVKANKKAESEAKTEAPAKEGRKSRVEKIEHPSGDFVVEYL